jgi:DNA-binding transcriptional LysR family regulator
MEDRLVCVQIDRGSAKGGEMFELKQLRKFVALAKQGNFTRAAEILHIAQPALSRQIAQLEEQVGVSLIDRKARPFGLTDAGRHFYEHALILLDQAERMEITTRKIGAQNRRVVTIAFSPTVVYGGLSDVMHRIREKRPELDVRWRELKSRDQADCLRKGLVDIGFSRYFQNDSEIVHIPMREESLFVAISPQHILAGSNAPLSVADLYGMDVIVYPRGSDNSLGFADQTLAWLQRAGRGPGEIHEVSEIDTALALVAAGMGFCLVPATSRHLRPDVAYRLIRDEDVMLPVFMCYRAQEDEALIAAVKAIIREFMVEDSASSLDPAYNRFHTF